LSFDWCRGHLQLVYRELRHRRPEGAKTLLDIIEDSDNGLSGLMRELMRDLHERFKLAEERLRGRRASRGARSAG
jgi:hypothetical protein